MAVTRDSTSSSSSSAAAAAAMDPPSSSSTANRPLASSSSLGGSSSRKAKDRGARFNEKHALKYGLSICSRNAKDNSVEMVMCKFCVAFGKESAAEATRKRRATQNIKYFRQPFRADHYLSHMEINHKSKWDEYEHATMPEKEVFFAAKTEAPPPPPQAVNGEASGAQGDNGGTTGTTGGGANAETAATSAAVNGPRLGPVRLPASEIEKEVVEVLVGEMLFNGNEEDGVNEEQALEVFVQTANGSGNYEIHIRNQRLYDLAIKFVANGASYRLASRLIYCTKEETKLAHYGGCTDAKVAGYVRAVLASNLQRLAWMMRAAWTYVVATETVHHQSTAYLDIRVRLWHNSGLRDFHLLTIPQFDRVPAPVIIARLAKMLDILDPRWRPKMLGTTAHSGLSTGRHHGITGNQHGLAARLTGLVTKPNFYLVWSGVHQLEVVAKNAVTTMASKTFYEQLAVVVQAVRRSPADETHLPGKDELVSLPMAHASPRGFVQTLMITLTWLLTNRLAVSSVVEAMSARTGAVSKLTAAWWVCAAAAQRLIAEVEFFIKKLSSMDLHDAMVQDQVQELAKLALIIKDVVGASRDLVDVFHAESPDAVTPSDTAQSVTRGSFVLSFHGAQQFIQNEGGAVAIEMFDQVEPLEAAQLSRCVAEFALDLIASIAAVAQEGRHFCTESTRVVVTPPRVMPYELYQMGKEEFANFVASQEQRLRETFTAQEVRRIQNEFYFFVAAVETEPILSGILKKHGRETDVSFAWSCLNSRFLYLQEFMGGMASAVPDAVSATLHAELQYFNWEKPDYRVTTVDFALEGILHARQKMQIEVVDVNHARAALRPFVEEPSSANDGQRRPVTAINTTTSVGGSLVVSTDVAVRGPDGDEVMEEVVLGESVAGEAHASGEKGDAAVIV